MSGKPPQDLAQLRESIADAARLEGEGRLEEASELLRTILNQPGLPAAAREVAAHNRIGVLKKQAEASLAAADHDGARAFLIKALATPTAATDETMIRHQAELFYGLGLSFFRQEQYAEALLAQRRAIALYPCPTYQNDLINTLSALREPSVLADYCDGLTDGELAPHLFIACQPKSGSTFLKNTLALITGFRDVFLFHASGQSEQELYLPALLEFATVPTVTQQHCRAGEANLQMMQAFGIRPVVLVRNLHDVVMSLHDFYMQGAVRGTYFDPAAFTAMDTAARLDLIIDHVVPWHLQFLASWQQAQRSGRLPLLWVTYESLMADKAGTLDRILSFSGVPATPDAIAAGLEATLADGRKNRLNRGIAGRGELGLSPAQKERIRTLANHFPHTDFTLLGI